MVSGNGTTAVESARGKRRPASRLRAILGAGVLTALLLLLLAPTADAAKNEEVEVPVTMQWFLGNGSPRQCYSIGMASWPEQEDAIAWELRYGYNSYDKTKTLYPPFNDDALDYEKYGYQTPGKGRHWATLVQGSGSHANPDWPPPDCSEIQSNQKAALHDVKLFVTLAANAKIVGKVRDVDGDPVSGVKVKAKGAGSDKTDGDGEYSIDVPETKKTYKVVPKKGKSEFKPKQRKVRVKPGQRKRANFKMKGFEISGRIDEGCAFSTCVINPIGGAKVKAKKGGSSVKAKTGADGTYSLIVPKKGKWKVKPRGKGMKMRPRKLKVKVNSKRERGNDFKACASGGPSLLSGTAQAADAGFTSYGRAFKEDGCVTEILASWDNSRSTLEAMQVSGGVICKKNNLTDEVKKYKFLFQRLADPQPNQPAGKVAMRFVGDNESGPGYTLTNASQITAIFDAAKSPPDQINVPWLDIDFTVQQASTFDRLKCESGWRGEDFQIPQLSG